MTTLQAEAEARPAEPDALIGKTVGGRFHVTDRIARGGMACVYFATQQPLNRQVAIKVMRADGGAEDQESFRRRFLREASMLAQLQHPNIVTLLDYGQISDLPDGHFFMAMEYLKGETLARRLRTRGPLTVVETLRLARQIGRGLREAHRRGFVHRDLKPSNIMLVPEDDQNDIVKLVDFGIGKVVAQTTAALAMTDDEDRTRVGLLLGSPRHMAPEQIRGDAIEPRTDLYGLGVILFQALSGRLPFDGSTEIEILVAHCSSPAPRLIDTCHDRFMPESLSRLVDSLLRKQAAARPTIYEFLLQLADVEDEVFGALGLAGPTSSGVSPLRRTYVDMSSELRTVTDQQPSAELLAALPSRDEARDPASFVAPVSAAPRRKQRLAIAILFACIGLIAMFAGVWRQSSVRPTLTFSAALPESARVAPKPVPTASNFVLDIDSLPRGATIIEDDVPLGKTPLTLIVDRSTLTSSKRQFSLELDGFVPYRFEQGDSPADVSVMAKLAPKPIPRATRVPSMRSELTKAPAAVSVNTSRGDPLEIRTRR